MPGPTSRGALFRSTSLVAVAALAALAGCLEPPAGAQTLVEIEHRTFAPTDLLVDNGTNVLFRNVDVEVHTVTVVRAEAVDAWLEDKQVPAGGEHGRRFVEAGDFVVFCRFHGDAASGQRMTLTVA